MPKHTPEARAALNNPNGGGGGDDLARQQAETSLASQEATANAAPPADEPLQASRLNTIASAIANAVETVSEDQVDAPDIAQVSGPQEIVPADIFQSIAGIATFIDSLGEVAAAHKYDPLEAVRTNAGLSEAEGKIIAFGKDKAVKKAVLSPEAPPGAEAPAAAPPEDETEGLV